MANHVSPNSVFAAFILPTRFWPRIHRELPFLAIALKNTPLSRNVNEVHTNSGIKLGPIVLFSRTFFFLRGTALLYNTPNRPLFEAPPKELLAPQQKSLDITTQLCSPGEKHSCHRVEDVCCWGCLSGGETQEFQQFGDMR